MSSLNYIAIMGRQPELGLVELEALLGASSIVPFGRQAVLMDRRLEIDRLGGVLKLGEVLYRGAITDLQNLPIDTADLPMQASKTSFALSVYGGSETPRSAMAAGLQLKKQLRTRGSVRLVLPSKGMAVSAAELHHNRVIEQGFELLVIIARSEMVVARTTQVQDIDWYSQRDYERPARSAKVGMLPPKLAQMLLNTTGSGPVYDPFCGTGVVLQEALLMERPAVGSDLSDEMVEASQRNLAWLRDNVNRSLPESSVQLADARKVRLVPDVAIVSEGYLGPNLSHAPASDELAKIKAELLDLYVAVLRNWSGQLASGSELAICAPAWRVKQSFSYLGLVDELPRLGYTLKGYKHVRTPLLYARDDQTVGRQLLLLRKN